MGRYLFTIPRSDRYPPDLLGRAQIIGLEGVPWTCSTSLDGELLVIMRHVALSGRLLVPFTSKDHGDVYMVTGTIPESIDPWQLDRELARGNLGRLRNQISIWEEGGLVIPEELHSEVTRLISLYSRGLFEGEAAESTSRTFDEVIDRSLELMFQIVREYVRQVQSIGESSPDHVAVRVGLCGDLSASAQMQIPVLEQFAEPTLSQSDIGEPDVAALGPVSAWAAETPSGDIRVIGPFIDFGMAALPEWLTGTETFEQRLARVRSVCREASRICGRDARLLHAVGGLSGVGQPHFNYPQQLQMALEILELLDRGFPNASLAASFDQPWGERLASASGGVAALEIAESLLRYGARLSAFGLEFNLGYWPHGTLVRDPLQWVDLIDRWSQFGLPLIIYFAAPIGSPGDLPSGRHAQTICDDGLTSQFRDDVRLIIDLVVSRPAVNAIGWMIPRDMEGSRFPLAGLLDVRGDVKAESESIIEALRG